jgi:hypothetical protein
LKQYNKSKQKLLGWPVPVIPRALSRHKTQKQLLVSKNVLVLCRVRHGVRRDCCFFFEIALYCFSLSPL